MREYIKKNKSNAIGAVLVCVIALSALIFFYWQKGINEFFISSICKLFLSFIS